MNPEEHEEYRKHREEEEATARRVMDAVAEAIRGSHWEVPDGVLKDYLLVMTFLDSDGDHMTVWINSGAWTTVEGMARRVIRDVEYNDLIRRREVMGDG